MENIKIKAKDLYKYIDELKNDDTITAVEVSIFDYEDDEGTTKKYLSIDILEAGGYGIISNEESIEEMTKEEIAQIP